MLQATYYPDILSFNMSVQCDRCPKFFKTEKDKDKHRESHIGFRCGICTQFFPGDAELGSHYMVDHDGNHAECKSCKKQFKWKSGLTKHIKKGRCPAESLIEETVQLGPVEDRFSPNMPQNSRAAELSKLADDIAWEHSLVKEERSVMRRSFLKYWETLSEDGRDSVALMRYANYQEESYDSRITALKRQKENVLLMRLMILQKESNLLNE